MNIITKIENFNGINVVSSRTIAHQLEKRHSHVIRDIDNILKSENPNLGSLIITSFYHDSII